MKKLNIIILVVQAKEQPKEPKDHSVLNTVVATLGLLVAILTFIFTFVVE